jgi:hypothetical protein
VAFTISFLEDSNLMIENKAYLSVGVWAMSAQSTRIPADKGELSLVLFLRSQVVRSRQMDALMVVGRFVDAKVDLFNEPVKEFDIRAIIRRETNVQVLGTILQESPLNLGQAVDL